MKKLILIFSAILITGGTIVHFSVHEQMTRLGVGPWGQYDSWRANKDIKGNETIAAIRAPSKTLLPIGLSFKEWELRMNKDGFKVTSGKHWIAHREHMSAKENQTIVYASRDVGPINCPAYYVVNATFKEQNLIEFSPQVTTSPNHQCY